MLLQADGLNGYYAVRIFVFGAGTVLLSENGPGTDRGSTHVHQTEGPSSRRNTITVSKTLDNWRWRRLLVRIFHDDDFGVAVSPEAMAKFLHEKYFPRMSWARLTLNPRKTLYFEIAILVAELLFRIASM